jgi:hypothetical protein
MKFIATLFILFSSFFATAQTQTNSDYQNIQGKWTCTTPKYKNHTFWVKGMAFFQKYRQGTLEQALPYEIKRFDYQEHDIDIVGLFTKCVDCYDVWTIQELTASKLVLINNETDEITEYKKVVTKSKN